MLPLSAAASDAPQAMYVIWLCQGAFDAAEGLVDWGWLCADVGAFLGTSAACVFHSLPTRLPLPLALGCKPCRAAAT